MNGAANCDVNDEGPVGGSKSSGGIDRRDAVLG